MRNLHHHHHQQQRLLLSLASLKCFIFLLLNAHLAKAEGAPSCYDEASSPTCPMFKSLTLFPFLTSSACGSASSLVFSGCDTASPNPTWPDFVSATITGNDTLGPPFVMDFSNPFSPSLPRHSNISHNSSISTISTAADSGFGLINLTWSAGYDTLIHKNTCQSLASLSQISHDLPQFIDLRSFAHSAFQFTPSNVILLFNCTSNLSPPFPYSLQKNSTACRSYAKECGLHKKESLSCYQYTPDRTLNLSEAMKTLHCENASFFVVSNLSIPVSQWSPGLIQLNWSTTNTSWMDSNYKSCELCLNSSGSCGYNDDDDFQCYCANHSDSDRICTLKTKSGSDAPCRNFICSMALKIAFGAVGGFVIALSLSLTLFCIWKKKVFRKTNVPFSSPHISKSWMKKPSFLWRRHDPILAKEMSYQEIVHATESFAERHMLGDGGFGAVYKGVLADGRKVAVKRLYHDNYRRIEHFFNEIKVLSNLDHPNLVKLYGFCYEDEKELLLVFEYAPQGTVSDQLHDASKPPISWKVRLDIACETAEALSYLHNSVIPPIYHRDVKTTNILLDEGFHVKLGDFGLSKLVPLKATHVSTAPQGTPGYLDPDYHQCYQLTDKSDVYSLGVVLMELISGKLAVDMSRERGEINLSTLAIMKIQCGQLEELVDPSLGMKKNACVERSIKRVVELAFQCLHAERDERPSMSFVAEILTKIRREHAEDGAEELPNIHINTNSTPTTCVSNGPKEHQDSPCSVFFSSTSSNPSSG